MSEWFQAKVEFLRQMDNGLVKKFTEQYLVDSMSFTECEARVLKEQGEGVREVTCKSIARSPIKEVVMYGDTDMWHKVKVTYSLMDEETEKEKKVTTYLLVNANDVREAYERTEEHLKDMLVPFQIPKIEESPIIEVFEYQKQAPMGFVKVNSTKTTGQDKAAELEERHLGKSNDSEFDASDWYEMLDDNQQQDLVDEFNKGDADFWLRSHGLSSDQAKDVISWIEEGAEQELEEDCAMEATDPTNGQAVAFDMPDDLLSILDEEGLNLTVAQLQRITEQAETLTRTEFISWLMAAHETDSRVSAEIWEVLNE